MERKGGADNFQLIIFEERVDWHCPNCGRQGVPNRIMGSHKNMLSGGECPAGNKLPVELRFGLVLVRPNRRREG